MQKLVDPFAAALPALFDKALRAENEMLFRQAFDKLYTWALNTLTRPRIPDITIARELAQDAMIAVLKKSRRELLKGEDYTRIVFTHLLGSKQANIPGEIRNHRKRKHKFSSIDEPMPNNTEGVSKKEMIPDNTPDPEKSTLILHAKKEQTYLLLHGLKTEIYEWQQKSNYEKKVETLEAFRNYVFSKIDGLPDEELIHLQICIVSAGGTQKLLDPELSDYLQGVLKLDQNLVRQRVNRHILKSPTVLGLLEENTR